VRPRNCYEDVLRLVGLGECMQIFVKSVIVLLVLSSKIIWASQVDEKSAKRLDGSDIIYYIQKPENIKKFPILLILQGSNCGSIYSSIAATQPLLEKAGVGRVDVEKYGLTKATPPTVCPPAYLQHNSIDQRVQDYLRVLQILRQTEPDWNRQLIIAGGSEGAVVAGIISSLIPETTKLVLMASGGGMSMREDMLTLQEAELRRGGASEPEVVQSLKETQSIMEEIKKNPTYLKTWAGITNTYLWWNSILDLIPLNYLVDINVPIFMVHGNADTAASVEGSRRVVEKFKTIGKTNLTYKEYPGLDHHWKDANGVSHSPEVLGDIFNWIFSK
jgi:pimeloyl-ACP methyl ester carboxylesterase